MSSHSNPAGGPQKSPPLISSGCFPTSTSTPSAPSTSHHLLTLAFEKMKSNLRKTGYPVTQIDVEACLCGRPVAFLPLMHHLFLAWSLPLTRHLSLSYDELNPHKTDLRFIEIVYKIMRREFPSQFQPLITINQFFKVGSYSQKKMDIISQIASLLFDFNNIIIARQTAIDSTARISTHRPRIASASSTSTSSLSPQKHPTPHETFPISHSTSPHHLSNSPNDNSTLQAITSTLERLTKSFFAFEERITFSIEDISKRMNAIESRTINLKNSPPRHIPINNPIYSTDQQLQNHSASLSTMIQPTIHSPSRPPCSTSSLPLNTFIPSSSDLISRVTAKLKETQDIIKSSSTLSHSSSSPNNQSSRLLLTPSHLLQG